MITNRKGLTLVEVMVSLSLLSLVLVTLCTFTLFYLTRHQAQVKDLYHKQQLSQAANLIEKRVREMDQLDLTYFPHTQTFRSRMPRPDHPGDILTWISFSGTHHHRPMTWLYHDASSATLRSNLNREHNVLFEHIQSVQVTELVPDTLIQITVLGKAGHSHQVMLYLPHDRSLL